MPKPLTAMQDKLLTYLQDFYKENDQLPPMQSIRDKFDWASCNSALTALRQLEKRELIEKNAVGKYRFFRFTVKVAPNFWGGLGKRSNKPGRSNAIHTA